MSDDLQTDNLVVTENYVAWVSQEPDGEVVYHIELGQVTVHLFAEEWEELVDLVQAAAIEARKRRK
ncbi:MAG: hypothetical protein JNJ61_22595 [Anaerolineae bacterium]|nr:hypothetical protein [Anaerolineae bacterium]